MFIGTVLILTLLACICLNCRYPKTDIVILCINLADKNTLINVSSTWIPEIKKYCNDKPIILGMFPIRIVHFHLEELLQMLFLR